MENTRIDAVGSHSFMLKRTDIFTVELFEISSDYLGEFIDPELPITYLRKFSIDRGAWEYFSAEEGAWRPMPKESWKWLNKQSELMLDWRV